jgi:hypothetical protein
MPASSREINFGPRRGDKAVSEHCIRLRGGWECRRLDVPFAAASRIGLPIDWGHNQPRRLQLIRRFGRPSVDAGSQVVLRLENAPGIQRLLLNGQSVPPPSPSDSRYEIPLDLAPDRNLLVLEVETPGTTDSEPASSKLWGEVAIVIRTGATGNG